MRRRQASFFMLVFAVVGVPFASAGAAKPPKPPVDLTASASGPTSLSVSWHEPDAKGVTGFAVWIDGSFARLTPQTSATLTRLDCEQRYRIEVEALDGFGNRSPRAGIAATTGSCPADTTPPESPPKLHATGVVATSVDLDWNASKDDRGVVEYGVWNGTAKVATTAKTAARITGLDCEQTYTFGVDAADAAGNRSPQSKVIVTTKNCPVDKRAPKAPKNLTLKSATADALTVVWDAAKDNKGVTGYDVWLDGAPATVTAATTATLTGLDCNRRYLVEVDAFDAAGNHSPRVGLNASTTACLRDTKPPTVPANVRVTGVTDASVTLAWDASIDDRGVVEYGVWDGTTKVATASGTTATVSGLDCGHAYAFGVDAADAAGNRSAKAPVAASTAACPADRYVSPTGTDYVWTHLATTYDGTTLRLYVNGTEVSSQVVSGDITVTPQPLRIGGNSVWGEWFSGAIDDVRVYSRALSAGQIGADLNTAVTSAKAAPDAAGLVAAYGFDETAGTVAKDASPGAHDGAVDGATWTSAGRHGGALQFDGTDDRVNVDDAKGSLDLTGAMTLEAWIRPDELGSMWRTVVLKEGDNALTYALYANTDTNSPSGHVFTDSEYQIHAPDPLPLSPCLRAAPCRTIDRAYHAATPGQTVELQPGTYPAEDAITADASKSSGPDVLLRPAAGTTVSLGELQIDGASHLELRDVHVNGWHILSGTDHVTLRNIVSPNLYIDSSSNISVIGGSYGPQVDFDDGQIRSACPGCPHSTNILIDGVSFHDATLSPGSDAHVECLQVWGTDHLIIRNSRFWNCQTHDVFVEGNGELVQDVTFENDFGGTVLTGFYSFRIAAGREGCVNDTIRYTSTLTPILAECGTASNVRIVGNVGPLSPMECDPRYTWSHNVWDGAACGASDLNAPSGFVDLGSLNLHLAPGSAAIDRGDPADYPATDIDGDRRPIGPAPDAGADER